MAVTLLLERVLDVVDPLDGEGVAPVVEAWANAMVVYKTANAVKRNFFIMWSFKSSARYIKIWFEIT